MNGPYCLSAASRCGCDVGKFRIDAANQCEVCHSGTFAATFGMVGGCTRCRAGKYGTATGQTTELSCQNCSVGKASYLIGTATESSCKDCLKGMYADVPSLSGCKICPQGYSMGVTGSSKCSACMPGQFNADKQKFRENHHSCDNCSLTGLPLSGNAAWFCEACPSGWRKSGQDSAPCVECPLGWKGMRDGRCVICGIGQYQRHNGTTACLPCIPGTYENQNGSTACKDCGAGQHQVLAGNETCFDCKVGQYMPGVGAVNCLNCNPGDFQNVSGKQSCQACAENTFTNISGRSSCFDCSRGKKAEKGSAKCINCGAGEAGTGDDGGCDNCAKGQFRAANGNKTDSCTPCRSGYYQQERGQASCLPCIPGLYQPVQGSEKCISCPAGEYQDLPHAKVCQPLASNAVVVGGGSTSVTVPLGSFKTNCSHNNEKTCQKFEQCPAGWVGNDPPSMNCTACTKGQTSSDGTPNNGCRTCAKGKFSNNNGASKCTKCPANWFQPQDTLPSTQCKACPRGYLQNITGESSCIDPGGIKPENCGDDEYWVPNKQTSNKAGCLKCPIGASCVGDITWTSVQPKFGWSRCASNPATFERCTFPAACLGGANAALVDKYFEGENHGENENSNDLARCSINCTAQCNTAYVNGSVLCGQCAYNYSHVGLTGQCDKCPDEGQNVGIAIGGVFATILCIFVFIQITLSDGGSLDESDGAKSIGLSFIQLLSLLVTFPIAW